MIPGCIARFLYVHNGKSHLQRLKATRLVIEAIEAGRDPSRLLSPRPNRSRLPSLPTSDGISPVKWLEPEEKESKMLGIAITTYHDVFA